MADSRKRAAAPAAGAQDDESDDDDFGPMPIADDSEGRTAEEGGDMTAAAPARKKAKKLPFEKTYIENLPSAEMYEHSFMHRDVVTHVAIAKSTEFLITGSTDGHVKFWKKMPENIEFVKHFQAHLGAIMSLVVSPDDKRLVTTSVDCMIKFFEIQSFDMSNMIKTEYTPTVAVWLRGQGGLYNRVAVADMNSGKIHLYRSDAGGSGTNAPLMMVDLHTQPVKCMALNVSVNVVISADAKGVIEYWDAESGLMPETPIVSFTYKTETDLYDLAKVCPSQIPLRSPYKSHTNYHRNLYDLAKVCPSQIPLRSPYKSHTNYYRNLYDLAKISDFTLGHAPPPSLLVIIIPCTTSPGQNRPLHDRHQSHRHTFRHYFSR